MKILILTNNANGLYLFRRELIEELKKRGDEVIVSLPEDEYSSPLRELGCRLIDTPFERRGQNPVRDLGLFRRYRKMLKKEKPDVVLTYTIKPNLYGSFACQIARIPYINNITGLGTALENGGLLSGALLLMYRKACMDASCVFFQNTGNKQFMQEQGIALHQARLLPGSGVNLVQHPYEEYPSEEKGIIFLAVIRVMKDKGIEEFLAAAEQIRGKYPHTRFWLAGDYEPETRDVYEPRVQALEEKGVLHYYGHSDRVHELMKESHVVVHPSYHEGMSNVLLEAAACGRPVLASDVPGCRETLLPGISGLTFPPKSTQGLTAAVENLLSYDASQRCVMGKKGREHIEAVFDRKLVVSAYLEEIQKTI